MKRIPFEIYNVFAQSPWGGNPLAIVPHADALSDTQMQLIARQFNLSETVFICTSDTADAALRIFTPEYEMAFAGHPTIGAAAWLHANLDFPDAFTLQLPAKTVRIMHDAGVFKLATAGYTHLPCALNDADLAAALGLHAQDVLAGARWMNAGTCQLIVPLSNAQALTRVRPQLQALQDVAVEFNRLNVYVWHQNSAHIDARYFFDNMGSVVEDPGTGSACANLGAWAHLNGHAPLNWQITQAQAINRPNHLYLNVTADGGIEVGGKVMAFARGEMAV